MLHVTSLELSFELSSKLDSHRSGKLGFELSTKLSSDMPYPLSRIQVQVISFALDEAVTL